MPRRTRDLFQASKDQAELGADDTSGLSDEAWEGLTVVYRRMVHILIFNERAVGQFGMVAPFTALQDVMTRQRDRVRDLMLRCRVAVPTFQRGVLAAPVPLDPVAAAAVARDELISLISEIDQLMDRNLMGCSGLAADLRTLRDVCINQIPQGEAT